MNIETRKGRKWITIEPSEYFVTDVQMIISTILGSCVSACLFDPINRVAGMNHFLLSSPMYTRRDVESIALEGRYGIHSMEILIKKMLAKGAAKKNIKAKVFGGGNVLSMNQNVPSNFAIGDRNILFIKEYLQNVRIPILSSALGGDVGRVIRFDTEDYAVYVKNIMSTNVAMIEQTEKMYLKTVDKKVTKYQNDKI